MAIGNKGHGVDLCEPGMSNGRICLRTLGGIKSCLGGLGNGLAQDSRLSAVCYSRGLYLGICSMISLASILIGEVDRTGCLQLIAVHTPRLVSRALDQLQHGRDGIIISRVDVQKDTL